MTRTYKIRAINHRALKMRDGLVGRIAARLALGHKIQSHYTVLLKPEELEEFVKKEAFEKDLSNNFVKRVSYYNQEGDSVQEFNARDQFDNGRAYSQEIPREKVFDCIREFSKGDIIVGTPWQVACHNIVADIYVSSYDVKSEWTGNSFGPHMGTFISINGRYTADRNYYMYQKGFDTFEERKDLRLDILSKGDVYDKKEFDKAKLKNGKVFGEETIKVTDKER